MTAINNNPAKTHANRVIATSPEDLTPAPPREHHFQLALARCFELWILTFLKSRQQRTSEQSHTVCYVTLSPTPISNS